MAPDRLKPACLSGRPNGAQRKTGIGSETAPIPLPSWSHQARVTTALHPPHDGARIPRPPMSIPPSVHHAIFVNSTFGGVSGRKPLRETRRRLALA